MSDIEIARQARLQRIVTLARDRLGISDDHLVPYGHHKAKLSLPFIDSLPRRPGAKDGRLVLVTAISPTPAGEGKTTTTVGLGDALNHIGRKALICGSRDARGRCQMLPHLLVVSVVNFCDPRLVGLR